LKRENTKIKCGQLLSCQTSQWPDKGGGKKQKETGKKESAITGGVYIDTTRKSGGNPEKEQRRG